MTRSPLLFASLVLAGVVGCRPAADPMDEIAESYVKLVLALGQHDAGYVDAYYGPEAWRAEAAADTLSLDVITARAGALLKRLPRIRASEPDELRELRIQYVARQLWALHARAVMLVGHPASFDQESQALYDAVAPVHEADEFEEVLAALDAALPGSGSVGDRYHAFRDAFVIPPTQLDTVFRAAIAECRARTVRHLDLPEGERFTVEYVTDQAWSAYNWYQGGFVSLIQVNTDLPITIDRAVDLACHEGYPGHHVYSALLEKHLVRDRGWVEYSVYPLYSPQSLIAEGSANYGIQMAFPGEERVAFERSVLFPLAGLDPDAAEQYYRTLELAERLDYAGNEAARRYLDGEIDAAAAAAWLERYQLMTPERAAQRVRFVDQYRSYVINYNLGRDLVADYVERESGGDPERAWAVFERLLSSPRLPGGLREPGMPDAPRDIAGRPAPRVGNP